MNYTPPISIGLPVYNGEDYLEQALKSLLGQTYGDFILIISDNASNDKTKEICHTYAAQDKRIQYFRNEENIGIARNFNRVFTLSKSPYFKWAACDDLVAPEFLEVCKEILDNEPEVILAYPKTTLIDAAGDILGTYEDGLNLVCRSPHGRWLQAFSNIWLVNPCFGLIRSEALKKTHLFGNYPNSDLVWLAELSLYGQFREAPHYLFYLRLHPSTQGGVIFSGNRVLPAKPVKDKVVDYLPHINSRSVFKHQPILLKHFITINQASIPINSKVLLSSFLLVYAGIAVFKKMFKKNNCKIL